jgi:peptidoglycan/xylan/chitin deacetylase (PgdA/CDA1 family)
MIRPFLFALALLLAAPAAAPAEEALCPAPGRPAEKAIRKAVPQAAVAVPATTDLAPARVLPAGLSGSIRRVELPAGEKLVALTFDLCETSNEVAGYDGEIVDELRRRKIPTTFFVGGHWAATHPGRYAELAGDPLFEVGNHTWTHADLRNRDDADLDRQVLAPEAAFRAALAEAPTCPGRPPVEAKRSTLFRFPFGTCDARSMAAVNAAGMAAIQWDVSTGDPSPLASARDIVEDTLRHVRPGSIVLAHANGRGWHTGEALPRLLDELTRRGYRPVTVSELLARGRPVVAETCFDAHPGDVDHRGARGAKRPPLPAPTPAAAQMLRP